MTWHETRARWRILREIATASDHDPTGARLDDLRRRNAGVLRILERYDAEKSREALAHAS